MLLEPARAERETIQGALRRMRMAAEAFGRFSSCLGLRRNYLPSEYVRVLLRRTSLAFIMVVLTDSPKAKPWGTLVLHRWGEEG